MWPLHFRKTVETQVDPCLTVMRLFKAYARRTTIDIGRATRYSWINKTWAHNSSWKQEWVEPKSVCNHTTFNHEYDRIRRYEVLLPINHNNNKIFDILEFFFFASSEKNPFEWWHVLSNYTVLLVLQDSWWPIGFENFVIVMIKSVHVFYFFYFFFHFRNPWKRFSL